MFSLSIDSFLRLLYSTRTTLLTRTNTFLLIHESKVSQIYRESRTRGHERFRDAVRLNLNATTEILLLLDFAELTDRRYRVLKLFRLSVNRCVKRTHVFLSAVCKCGPARIHRAGQDRDPYRSRQGASVSG